jgi:hypothetical protein
VWRRVSEAAEDMAGMMTSMMRDKKYQRRDNVNGDRLDWVEVAES